MTLLTDPTRPPTRPPATGRATLVLLLTVGATAAAIATVRWVAVRTGVDWSPGGDLAIYRDAAHAVLVGASPYEVARDGYGFVYPPFAALLMIPLAQAAPAVAYGVFTAASVLAVPVVVGLLVDQLAPTSRRRPVLLAVATVAVLPLSPVAGTLLLGNINLLLLLLVLVDLLRVRGRHQGILVGIAAGIKLTPLIFIVYLLLTGRTRAGLTAVASFLSTVTVAFVVLPAASVTYWGGAFLDSSRTRPSGEQAYGSSVRGSAAHLLPPVWQSVWLPVTVLVAVAGLAVAALAYRRHDELTAILACAVTGLLVAPVTWYAHWVWCIPVLALVVARTRSRSGWLLAAALWLVFALPLPWWIAHVLGWAPVPESTWVLPMDLLYLLTGGALLILATTWLNRTDPTGLTRTAPVRPVRRTPTGRS